MPGVYFRRTGSISLLVRRMLNGRYKPQLIIKDLMLRTAAATKIPDSHGADANRCKTVSQEFGKFIFKTARNCTAGRPKKTYK